MAAYGVTTRPTRRGAVQEGAWPVEGGPMHQGTLPQSHLAIFLELSKGAKSTSGEGGLPKRLTSVGSARQFQKVPEDGHSSGRPLFTFLAL